MPIVPESERKNAFSQRLKDKREKAVVEAGMTPEEMSAFEKMYRAARIAIGNLHVVISEPSPAQAEEIGSRLDELVEEIQKIRPSLA